MRRNLLLTLLTLVGVTFAVYAFQASVAMDPPDVGKPGGPIKGLTRDQLRLFEEGKQLFVKDFEPEEGLGPLFNAKSCYECHGKPYTPGTEAASLSISRVRKVGKLRPTSAFAKMLPRYQIGSVYPIDVDPMTYAGGQALAVRSICEEYPDKFGKFCVKPARTPSDATFVSFRQSPMLLGLGLIGAIPDRELAAAAQKQRSVYNTPFGRYVEGVTPFEREPKALKFGWKSTHPSVSTFVLEAMNNEMGITTPMHLKAKSADLPGRFPHALAAALPKDPNDSGNTALKISFYLNTLAPPPRGTITAQAKYGEKVFEKVGCTLCHVPQFRTADQVWLPDPETNSKTLSARLVKFAASPTVQVKGDDSRYIEVNALENQPVRAYSDFLLHKMGETLADGIPEGAAGGDYWRTTPLWGLHLKTHYLHDARTTSLRDAIQAHEGQANDSRIAYEELSPKDKEALMAFLRSL